jgi:hypothetical protein
VKLPARDFPSADIKRVTLATRFSTSQLVARRQFSKKISCIEASSGKTNIFVASFENSSVILH